MTPRPEDDAGDRRPGPRDRPPRDRPPRDRPPRDRPRRDHRGRVDEELRRATAEGAFRDLPGAGKPLPRGGDDENWWIRDKLRREGVPTEALLPTSLRLRKEIAALPETVRALRSETAVRSAAADLARRVRDYTLVPTPPHVVVPRVDVEAVVARWHAERPAPPPPPAEPPAPPPRPRWWRLRRS